VTTAGKNKFVVNVVKAFHDETMEQYKIFKALYYAPLFQIPDGSAVTIEALAQTFTECVRSTGGDELIIGMVKECHREMMDNYIEAATTAVSLELKKWQRTAICKRSSLTAVANFRREVQGWGGGDSSIASMIEKGIRGIKRVGRERRREEKKRQKRNKAKV
jgi:hypothetical protein